MTKEDLLDLINSIPDGSEVMFSENTGNYWRHVKAVEITDIMPVSVQYSEYLQSDQVIDDDRLEEENGEVTYSGKPVRQVYLIS